MLCNFVHVWELSHDCLSFFCKIVSASNTKFARTYFSPRFARIFLNRYPANITYNFPCPKLFSCHDRLHRNIQKQSQLLELGIFQTPKALKKRNEKGGMHSIDSVRIVKPWGG